MLWVLAWTYPLSKPVSIGGLRLRRVLKLQGEINMVGEGNDLRVWVRSSLPLMPITPSCHQLHTDTFWTAPLSCNAIGLYHHLRHPGEEKDFRAITTESLLVSKGNLLFTYHSEVLHHPICPHAASDLELNVLFEILWWRLLNKTIGTINLLVTVTPMPRKLKVALFSIPGNTSLLQVKLWKMVIFIGMWQLKNTLLHWQWHLCELRLRRTSLCVLCRRRVVNVILSLC